MKLYRVSTTGGDGSVVNGEHQGYSYFSNKTDANRLVRENKSNDYDSEVHEINVEISKRGIISALNQYGDHPDNG